MGDMTEAPAVDLSALDLQVDQAFLIYPQGKVIRGSNLTKIV